MTIRYTNGLTLEAALLSRTETKMRIAMQGSDDVIELNLMGGTQNGTTWVTDDCEPVQVEFAWNRPRPTVPVDEADCICSHELAAHLIHLLYAGDDEPGVDAPAIRHVDMTAAFRGAVS